MTDDTGVRGFVKPGFEAVRDAFAVDRPGVNAALAVHVHGERVIDVWTGPDHREDSIMGVYSSTKGASGVVLALLIERGLVDPDAPVADYWPEFAAAGKHGITVRVLASHQAGLVNVDGGFEFTELIEHTPLAERLAAQAPFWEPGKGHGYHALTIGTLLDELVRRVTGMPLGEYFRREIAEPYGIDFFIGLPEAEEPRILPVKPISSTGAPSLPPNSPPFFLQAMNITPPPEAGSRGIDRPPADGGQRRGDLLSIREFRAAGVPSIGGFGSARGLAALYAAVLPGAGTPLLSEKTIRTVTEIHATGDDLALPFPTGFGLVFQRPARYANPGSFGHDGAAGANAYADPDLGVAFGYVTDTTTGGGADPLAGDLTTALTRVLA
ncbi:serine hydrolase domain-containing protein [Actinomadura rubrisoli]|uniref:Class A beta-lactamase-related serine hydrolase n=1 Tax=Actinomadura rubrisoli TaxID=2530368 RepID=A0A4R5B7K1_9ACTN|nr:serine hydrolase domain-containing protein [Actinomadura rubrisoli]TDD81911.1 class A beta-lactamase-related serine hydrolase [Actinomadura rubrisoli]